MHPDDVDPDSGFRLPLPKRETLEESARRTYDSLADPTGGTLAGLRGPGGIRLYSPALSQHSQALNRYLRREAGFTAHVRELAILVTARELDSQFEWAAHEPEALREGMPPALIDIVRRRGSTEGLDETDATIIALGREMFLARRVTPATFARALKLFGPRGLVDLVSLMGNYAGTAALLTAFDMQLPAGQAPLLPVP